MRMRVIAYETIVMVHRKSLNILLNFLPVALGLFSASSSVSAQMTLNADQSGPIQMQITSWRDIPFRRIVRQKYDFSCGSAAVATLLTYQYATPTTENDAFTAMWRNGDRSVIAKAGFSLFDMKRYLAERGFAAEGFRIGRAELSKAQQSMIVLVENNGFKHFVVIKGVRDDSVLIGDPIRGLIRVPMGDFLKSWKGIVLAITKRPLNLPATFNSTEEWTPWASAPVDTVPRTTIGELTSNFPPIYQITANAVEIPPAGIAP